MRSQHTRLPILTCAVAALTLSTPASARTWPTKPIRTIVTVSGGVETAVRALSSKMAETLGQPVIVEAQSGAASAQGASAVARATPDSYTIAYATSSAMLIRPFLAKNTPYDTLRDFTAITQIGEAVANVLVANSGGGQGEDARDGHGQAPERRGMPLGSLRRSALLGPIWTEWSKLTQRNGG